MRSLLLVESFDFRPSNQYILVRVSPSCFRFAKMCLCQVSFLSRCSQRYLTSSSWGSCTLFIIWTRGHVSLHVVNVMCIDLGSLAFILHFNLINWKQRIFLSVFGFHPVIRAVCVVFPVCSRHAVPNTFAILELNLCHAPKHVVKRGSEKRQNKTQCCDSRYRLVSYIYIYIYF
jgi:hypothetical protein